MNLYYSKTHAVIRPLASVRLDDVLVENKENLAVSAILMNHYLGKDSSYVFYDISINDSQWEGFRLFVKAHGHDAVIGAVW